MSKIGPLGTSCHCKSSFNMEKTMISGCSSLESSFMALTIFHILSMRQSKIKRSLITAFLLSLRRWRRKILTYQCSAGWDRSKITVIIPHPLLDTRQVIFNPCTWKWVLFIRTRGRSAGASPFLLLLLLLVLEASWIKSGWKGGGIHRRYLVNIK